MKNKSLQLAGLLLAGLLIVGGYVHREALASNIRDLTGINEKRNGSFTGDVTIGGTLGVTGAVTIPDSTITTAKLAADAVTSAKILDSEVTTSKVKGSTPGGALCDLGLASGAFGTCSNADASVCNCS